MINRLKDIYNTFLIMTYGINFFGGGFFYAAIVTKDENVAVASSLICMALSFCLYVKMDDNSNTIFEESERLYFSIIVLLMYIVPFLIKRV